MKIYEVRSGKRAASILEGTFLDERPACDYARSLTRELAISTWVVEGWSNASLDEDEDDDE